jgi:hypothetical protein
LECNMSLDNKDFTWHNPESLRDEQMHQEGNEY